MQKTPCCNVEWESEWIEYDTGDDGYVDGDIEYFCPKCKQRIDG